MCSSNLEASFVRGGEHFDSIFIHHILIVSDFKLPPISSTDFSPHSIFSYVLKEKIFRIYPFFSMQRNMHLHFKTSHSITLTKKLPKTMIKESCGKQREEKQRKQTVCVIAPWQPIGTLSHECNQNWLLDLPCPAGEPVIVHRRTRGWGGRRAKYSRWDSWQPPAEPCGLIARPRKCMQQTDIKSTQLIAMPV